MIVTRPLLNTEDLAAWARGEGFHDLRPSSWHLSVVRFSENPPGMTFDRSVVVVPPSQGRRVRRFGPFTVLTFSSFVLHARHRALIAAGGRWDHTPYRPHVTFSVENESAPDSVKPFEGPLTFGPEVWPYSEM